MATPCTGPRYCSHQIIWLGAQLGSPGSPRAGGGAGRGEFGGAPWPQRGGEKLRKAAPRRPVTNTTYRGVQAHVHGIQNEVVLVPNIPALVGIDALQQQINANHLQIVALLGQMQEQIVGMQEQFGGMQEQFAGMQNEYLYRSQLG
ncbi:unnamed protein product [Tuber aestivum]|uniref:Uncharacterized protein n=1 Tax=Tuber aestivum TaxID=59557 RepID=A0A292PPJ2_9PEZI|nr:unnamed protein product [Tuber aestivum]